MGDMSDIFREMKQHKKAYRAKLKTCPKCFERNPGGATKMTPIKNGWRCHYCKYKEIL